MNVSPGFLGDPPFIHSYQDSIHLDISTEKVQIRRTIDEKIDGGANHRSGETEVRS